MLLNIFHKQLVKTMFRFANKILPARTRCKTDHQVLEKGALFFICK